MNEGHQTEDVTDGVTDPELVSIVVEDDDAPDRCTIFNPESTGFDRMSRWITAEATQFVDLDGMR